MNDFWSTIAGQRFIGVLTDGVRQIRRLNSNIEKLLEVYRGDAGKVVKVGSGAVDPAGGDRLAGQSGRGDGDSG